MGLPSRVGGRQTLMYMFSSEYMNPIPCGVKVNGVGLSPVLCGLEGAPIYK